MSVIQLELSDAQVDPLLVVTYLPDWSAMRSGHSEREIFAYSVRSDSGNIYETEIFLSDRNTICGFCGCPARLICRHLKAALADLLERVPTFGEKIFKPEGGHCANLQD
jgi:hypothetical protein